MNQIHSLFRWLRAELRAERLAAQAQKGLRKDRRHVTPWLPCACCGGTSTVLRFDTPSWQYACKDRVLCRQVMIMTSLLQSSHGEGS